LITKRPHLIGTLAIAVLLCASCQDSTALPWWGELGLRFGAITLMQIFPADVIAAVRGFITKRLHLIGTLAIAVLLLRRRVANYLPTNKNYE